MSTHHMSLTGFAAHLAHTALHMRVHGRHALLEAGEIVRQEVFDAHGAYRYNWPALAPATVARKRTGDSPLLETGAKRASYGVNLIDDHTVEVGSNDPKATWHELGTSRVPPRPVLLPAVLAKEKEVAKHIGDSFLRTLVTP